MNILIFCLTLCFPSGVIRAEDTHMVDSEFHQQLLSYLTRHQAQGEGDAPAMLSEERIKIRSEVRSLVGLGREELLEALDKMKQRLNSEYLALLVMSVILQRKDTGNILPFPHQVMPDKFFTGPVLARVRAQAKLNTSEQITICWDSPPYQTLSSTVTEHRLWYFREDPLVNGHHWHWHLIYTFGLPESPVVNLERRGESFYYMHNQMMARYNTERLMNDMPIPEPYNRTAWSQPIPLGYFSKLSDRVANVRQPGRPDNMTLKTTFRYGREMSIERMEFTEDNILEAIDSGFILSEDGVIIPLEYVNGIDHGIEHLANIVEISAKEISVNRERYGTLHDDVHLMIGVIHDPDYTHLEPPSAMGYHSSALRDPLFYPWHHHLNTNIFQRYKATLPPYIDQELQFPGVEIMEVFITTDDVEEIDTLETVADWAEVILPTGAVFGQDDPAFSPVHTNPVAGPGVNMRYKQLNHKPYNINLVIRNDNDHYSEGWVRVFLTPDTSENQRMLMVEIDRFPVTLLPRETKEISRQSKDSSVIMKIPEGLEYGDLQSSLESGNITAEEFNRLGCGWPGHLLISKGTPDGSRFNLFVIVSKLLDGEVLPSDPGQPFTLCGTRGNHFPDARPMGFPVDRPAPCQEGEGCQGQDWRNLIRGRKNMRAKYVEIVHVSDQV